MQISRISGPEVARCHLCRCFAILSMRPPLHGLWRSLTVHPSHLPAFCPQGIARWKKSVRYTLFFNPARRYFCSHHLGQTLSNVWLAARSLGLEAFLRQLRVSLKLGSPFLRKRVAGHSVGHQKSSTVGWLAYCPPRHVKNVVSQMKAPK